MDVRTPLHRTAQCPYCESTLRRVPGVWLGRSGFTCPRCGDFVDFSRALDARDDTGLVDDAADELTEPD